MFSCGVCGNVVDSGSDAFQCIRCHYWVHATCIDKSKRLTVAVQKTISGNGYFPFLCRNCQASPSRGGPSQIQFDTIMEELASVKDQLAAIQRDNAELRKQNEALRSELQAIRAGGGGAQQTSISVEPTVLECFEKQYKIKNCVVGLKEDRNENIRQAVEQMAHHAGVPAEDIKDVYRDGQKHPDRARIVKVRFARRPAKMTFLRHSRNYRELGPKYDRCFVRNDMTYAERCLDRQLRDELKAMPDEEREQFMIRDFKIVKRRFARPLKGE